VGRAEGDVLVPGNVRPRERVDADGTITWSLSSGYRSMRAGDLVWLYAAGHQVRLWHTFRDRWLARVVMPG